MRKYYFLFLFLSLICFNQQPATAWNETGHMIVAEIAQMHLTSKAKTEADRLIHFFSSAYPQSSCFISASTWADELRANGLEAFSQWHYIVKPYDPEGTLSSKHLAQILAEQKSNNVEWAIDQCIKTLKNPKANDFEKGFMLRLLMHFVADIHQPMHCATLFSKKFPKGDYGGNLYRVKSVEKNLHSYWDCAAGLFHPISKPLNDKGLHSIHLLVQDIMQSFPPVGQELLNLKISQWTEESHSIAVLNSYQIPENTKPSIGYVHMVQHISKERVALAGYRLAYVLNGIFE